MTPDAKRRYRTLILLLGAICAVQTVALIWLRDRAQAPALRTPELPVMGLLDRPVRQIEFHDTPIEECIAKVGEAAGVNIDVNWPELSKAGCQQGQPMTFDVEAGTVRSALAQFSPLRGSIVVESRGRVLLGWPPPMVLRMYDVSDLVTRQVGLTSEWRSPTQRPSFNDFHDFRNDPDDWSRPLSNLITASVASASWREQGGEAQIGVWRGRLIVQQTEEIQAQVAAFLRILHDWPTVEPPTSQDPSDAPWTDRDTLRRLCNRPVGGLHFKNASFKEAIEEIARASGQPIVFDSEGVNAGPEILVTLDVGPTSTGATLRLVIDSSANQMSMPPELGVKQGTLYVGSNPLFLPPMFTRAYSIHDLAVANIRTRHHLKPGAQLPPNEKDDYDEECDHIQSTVLILARAYGMRDHGTDSGSMRTWAGRLLVTQTEGGHAAVRRVLAEMRSSLGRPALPEASPAQGRTQPGTQP